MTQIPEALMNGFTGRPDDTPYLEESFAIEWNTLEYWDVPYLWAAQAATWWIQNADKPFEALTSSMLPHKKDL